MNEPPLGVGVDVVALSRMRDVLDTSGDAFCRRVFTPREREIAESRPDPVARLAMTFAAKEAVFKTLGIGWDSGVELAEVEVCEGAHGEPIVALAGRFAAVAAERGVSRILLSLSSDGDVAIAVAIACG